MNDLFNPQQQSGRKNKSSVDFKKAGLNRAQFLKLLENSPPHGAHENTLISYFSTLVDQNKLSGGENAVSRLTPIDAYKCLFDGLRTERFIRGIQSTLQSCDQRYNSYTVIDAGTGPVPVMALAAALLSPKAKIIGMELDRSSFSEAQKVIRAQRLESRTSMPPHTSLILQLTLK